MGSSVQEKATVLFLGEEGCGKSSLLHLLFGDQVMLVEDGVEEVTQEVHSSPPMTLDGTTYINIPSESQTPTTDNKVQALFQRVSKGNGVGLLVLVHNALSNVSVTVRIYEEYAIKVCKQKIPVILVITHLDHYIELERGKMEKTIRSELGKSGIFFQDCQAACAANLEDPQIIMNPQAREYISALRQQSKEALLAAIDKHAVFPGWTLSADGAKIPSCGIC